MDRVLDKPTFNRLAQDRRTIRLPLMERPYTRSELRARILSAGLVPRLDYDSDRILAGRTGDLVYNWTNGPLRVTISTASAPLDLAPHVTRWIE